MLKSIYFLCLLYLFKQYVFIAVWKAKSQKRNAMYNVNPATAKILMKMRTKEEGGLRRGGERKGNIFKKEMEAILCRSSQTLAFQLLW